MEDIIINIIVNIYFINTLNELLYTKNLLENMGEVNNNLFNIYNQTHINNDINNHICILILFQKIIKLIFGGVFDSKKKMVPPLAAEGGTYGITVDKLYDIIPISHVGLIFF